jgi:hypothetical protein
MKRSAIGAANEQFFSARTVSTNPFTQFRFINDALNFVDRNSSSVITGSYTTNALFRDVSAWYHIVFAIDTTQATAANRVIIYVNGVSQTLTVGTTISQNVDTSVNVNTIVHNIGAENSGQILFNGYLTEVNFIDGQALTPSSFGQINASTGVWEPIAYTGTYGTNGFYLSFSDNTSTTTLGDDFSGNGNDWTTNNFSVTAGVGNDSLVDSPMAYGTDTGVGGEVRGNYATLNPLYNSGGTRTFANGNLEVTGGALNVNSTELANWTLTSGKWYFEATVGAIGTASITSVGTNAILYEGDGSFFPSGSGASYTTNDVIGVAIDIDAGTVQFYKNGVSQGTVNGTAGASATPAFALGGAATAPKWIANFGQRAFAYTAPSGFQALVTTNLPTPTIGATSTTQANDYFNTVLYTGNNDSAQSITSVGFQPDFIWIKNRNASNHVLVDAVRGRGFHLSSSLTNAEATDSSTQGVTAFLSNGFSVEGDPAGYGSVNDLTDPFVAWNWNAGGSNATNTSGTITSTVRANTTSGFSIVTYTGNGANASATIGHGLGVVPSMLILKFRDETSAWSVYHASIGNTKRLTLNTTDAESSPSIDFWNNTSPTSSVFSVGSTFNQSTVYNYVAYCFAPVAGYSAFGSYTGNGAADGPFVFTGFRPRYVMFKRTDSTGSWFIEDSARGTYNVMGPELYANDSAAEATVSRLDFLSNGFKMRAANAGDNASGGTYIYMAFAESPFKYSLGR